MEGEGGREAKLRGVHSFLDTHKWMNRGCELGEGGGGAEAPVLTVGVPSPA